MSPFKKTECEALGKMHPLFKGLLWVSTARSDDETRYVLQHILVEREGLLTRLVATDGKRLHLHEYDAGLFEDDICEDMLEPGLYELVAKSKSALVVARCEDDSLRYPHWRQVIPDYSPQHSAMVTAQTVGIFSAKTGVLLAVDYIQLACGFGCGGESNITVTYGQECKGGAFVVKHDLGKAIVMPIKWGDEDAEDEKAATAKFKGFEVVENEDEDEPELIPQ